MTNHRLSDRKSIEVLVDLLSCNRAFSTVVENVNIKFISGGKLPNPISLHCYYGRMYCCKSLSHWCRSLALVEIIKIFVPSSKCETKLFLFLFSCSFCFFVFSLFFFAFEFYIEL